MQQQVYRVRAMTPGLRDAGARPGDLITVRRGDRIVLIRVLPLRTTEGALRPALASGAIAEVDGTGATPNRPHGLIAQEAFPRLGLVR